MNLTPETKIIVQGIAETVGSHYASRMKAYSTNIVAGVSVGQGGQQIDEIPVFDLVEEAISALGTVDTSLIFVEPYKVLDAAREAIAAGIRQIVIVSGGVPPLDMVMLMQKARATNTLILGAGSAGLLVPDRIWLGTCEPQFYTPGKVGIISRNDFLAAEVALELNSSGLGESIVVNIGTEGIVGLNFEDWLQVLEKDPDTEAIVLLGQSFSSAEANIPEYITSAISKPTIAYLAGVQAPVEKTFENAASIIANQLSYSVPASSSDRETIAAFGKAKIPVAKRPSQIPDLVKKALSASVNSFQ